MRVPIAKMMMERLIDLSTSMNFTVHTAHYKLFMQICTFIAHFLFSFSPSSFDVVHSSIFFSIDFAFNHRCAYWWWFLYNIVFLAAGLIFGSPLYICRIQKITTEQSLVLNVWVLCVRCRRIYYTCTYLKCSRKIAVDKIIIKTHLLAACGFELYLIFIFVHFLHLLSFFSFLFSI